MKVTLIPIEVQDFTLGRQVCNKVQQLRIAVV